MLVSRSPQFNNYHKRKLKPDSNLTNPGDMHPNNTRYKNSIQKPLKVRDEQVTFKGFYNFNGAKKLFTTTVEILPKNIHDFTFDTLAQISDKQASTYKKIAQDFVERVKTDESFRKRLKITPEMAKQVSMENLPDLPQKGQFLLFAESLVDPILAPFKWGKKLIKGKFGEKFLPNLHNKFTNQIQQDKLISEYKGFLGLMDSVKIWENSYRNTSGNVRWQAGDNFLIPVDVLKGKILRRRPKAHDPEKGKYSSKSLMIGNRFVSGLIASAFLSSDAFNTTMRLSGNKDESQKQQKSRFAQENARVGLNLYLFNVVFKTFEKQTNKSLLNALLAAGATVAMSEIAGRLMVSKPIMPSDKKTLDEKEKEMLSKKGFFPTLGRLMTRVKKVDPKKVALNNNSTQNKDNKAQPQSALNPFNALDSSKTNNSPSFTGSANVAQMFDAKRVSKVLDVVKQFDADQYKYYKQTIEKGLKSVRKLDGVDISGMDLEEILKRVSQLPVGDKPTLTTRITKSVFAPIYWIKNGFKSIVAKFKKVSPAMKMQEMESFISKNKMDSEFSEYLNKSLSLEVWQSSRFSLDVKKQKIMEEFVDNKKKISEEVQGVKNVILWLEKQIKTNKINLDNISKEQRTQLEGMLKKAMIAADGSKQQEYDGNTLTQLNIHIARIITTIFLVTDAYNLTMQYSNDNKSEANKSAKGRAVQEITRISVSAYVLGFIHNLMSRVCNSSLAGAFAVTAMTSVANDSLSRKAIGIPLTPQSQDKLLEKDKKKQAKREAKELNSK